MVTVDTDRVIIQAPPGQWGRLVTMTEPIPVRADRPITLTLLDANPQSLLQEKGNVALTVQRNPANGQAQVAATNLSGFTINSIVVQWFAFRV